MLVNLSNFQVPNLQKFKFQKITKMTFWDRLNLPKFDFTNNWSDGEIVKYQQSRALTSHFESFWSIVTRWNYVLVPEVNEYKVS